MKKELKRLQSLFGVVSSTVRLFEAEMQGVTPEELLQLLGKTEIWED